MSAGLPLIVTRAEPGCAVTVGRAAAMGLDARAMPLFAARALNWIPPDASSFDALLLTSAQAPRLAGAGLASLSSLPAFAVGAATARSATDAGLQVALTGAADVQDLLDAMTSQGIERILWLCGRDRTNFDARETDLAPLPVYAVDPADPPPGWADLIAARAVVMAHSARGASRVAGRAGAARKHLTLLAISPAVAAAAGEGWCETAVSAQYGDAAMLAEAHALCNKGA